MLPRIVLYTRIIKGLHNGAELSHNVIIDQLTHDTYIKITQHFQIPFMGQYFKLSVRKEAE